MLPGPAQAVTYALMEWLAAKCLAIEQHGSVIRLHHPANQIEEGGLAGAVRADQADNAAGLQRQIDVSRHHNAVEALAEILDFKDAGHQRISPTFGCGTARQMSLAGTSPCGRKNMKTSTSPVNRSP